MRYALGLYFLAPLVAEFLLGDIPIFVVPAYLFSSLIYGGGALVIREVVRRLGYGWPTMLLFALAYGVLEEGVATMTLWNPFYQHTWTLLAYGQAPWTLFVLGLHSIWSISVPIAIMEAISGGTRPWLRTRGLIVAAVLFLLGVGLGLPAAILADGFVASPAQFGGAVAAVLVLVTLGLYAGRHPRVRLEGKVPRPWVMWAVSLVAGSAFLLVYAADPTGISPWLAAAHLPAWLATVLYLLLYAGVAVPVGRWSRRAGWSDAHRFGLAGGALLAYTWHGFPWTSMYRTSLAIDLASNAVLAVFAVALLAFAVRRVSRSTPRSGPSSSP